MAHSIDSMKPLFYFITIPFVPLSQSHLPSTLKNHTLHSIISVSPVFIAVDIFRPQPLDVGIYFVSYAYACDGHPDVSTHLPPPQTLVSWGLEEECFFGNYNTEWK